MSQPSGRFGGQACLPLTAGADASLAELRRCVEKNGHWGIAVGANVAGRPLDDEAFHPVYEELNRLGLPVLIHPMVPEGAEMLGDFFLISAVGFMFDTTAAVARLLFKGILERFPDIKFIAPHMGAAVPYLAGQWESAFSRGGPYTDLPHPPTHLPEAALLRLPGLPGAFSAVRRGGHRLRPVPVRHRLPLSQEHDAGHRRRRGDGLDAGGQGGHLSPDGEWS